MLTLPIKRKWFDMIVSGEKKEEYREIKPYWTSRFSKIAGRDGAFPVMLRAGYSKNSPSFIVNVKLTQGYGRREWGAPEDKEVYILTILDMVESSKSGEKMGQVCFYLERKRKLVTLWFGGLGKRKFKYDREDFEIVNGNVKMTFHNSNRGWLYVVVNPNDNELLSIDFFKSKTTG